MKLARTKRTRAALPEYMLTRKGKWIELGTPQESAQIRRGIAADPDAPPLLTAYQIRQMRTAGEIRQEMTHKRAVVAMVNGMRPIHPGEVLREEYLKPLRMSVGKLARALRITRTMAREILRERRPITPKISVRLAQYFGGDARLWMNMQQSYEVKIAQGEAGIWVMNEAAPRNARL